MVDVEGKHHCHRCAAVRAMSRCGIVAFRMLPRPRGHSIQVDIFIGPVYYQRLRHMVSDKFQVPVSG